MKRTVVVIGGGYGGTRVALALDSAADVILIDPREAFVNAAASLRALTRPDWAHHAFLPLEDLLDHGRVLRDRAVSVDPGGVTLASGARVEADYLVLATGSGYPYPAKPHDASTSIAEQLDDLCATHKELSGAGRVLILGAGPVGLELAGEIKEVWPDKHVVIVDRGDQLLPGFLPEVRAELHRQLDELGVELRLGTAMPATAVGATDIRFRAFGVRINTDFLADGRLTPLTARAEVPVTERLNVEGYEHVYAVGDITALPDPKMASYAMTHAEVVVRNIRAQLDGDRPAAVYTPSAERRILLPLGTRGGVGQLPTPDGVAAASARVVYERKGADLFTGRFGPGSRSA
ncbi:NAD(P)/FAD-dependent oxidoreductase [Paractinoplanes toevensis]|uniref:Pyridine nucleotide-disulfide oxidoreductase n=1 Tax=Paractinoplanes toevensis TaxID=571911 RepID=A0A919W801_9ACTN|nr:FAD-dependent oxidoreductase [Actinoplanes toevensis]GIM91281.1 pyridine nucleotide-disulfide oxidoreductase [Actinoplanes toevensis]